MVHGGWEQLELLTEMRVCRHDAADAERSCGPLRGGRQGGGRQRSG